VQDVDGSPAKVRALLELGRLSQAGPAAHRATELHPNDAAAWFSLAQLEQQNGNLIEALDALKRSVALEKNPQAEELRKALLRRLGK
jgi:tetratricopeptide (TPR) repeat protein